MALKIITITIDEAGDQTVDLTGYQGKGCDAVADVFGRAVGATTKVVHKPEHNKPMINKNVIRQ
jgi:uncharacterized membrane protein YjdF